MATGKRRADNDVRGVAIRTAISVLLAAAGAACANFPTAPDSADMQKWNGDPVITTCVNANCPTVRAP